MAGNAEEEEEEKSGFLLDKEGRPTGEQRFEFSAGKGEAILLMKLNQAVSFQTLLANIQ